MINKVTKMKNTNIPHLLRLSEVREITRLSKSSIYTYMNAGTFPKSISLGTRSVAWLASEVNLWIENRITQRDQLVA